MKILCIASEQPGHIDFGGRGYVALAAELARRGHEVHWLTCGAQVARLQAAGFDVIIEPALGGMGLLPFAEQQKDARSDVLHRQRIEAIRHVAKLVSSRRPALVLVDRLLVYCGVVLRHLEVPFVAVGAPNGYWRFDQVTAIPAATPAEEYLRYGERLGRDVGWSAIQLDSAWLRSPFLHVCFTGRSFYGGAVLEQDRCAYVRHYDTPAGGEERTAFGISFGNQGHEPIMRHFLECYSGRIPEGEIVEVFAGNSARLAGELRSRYNGRREIRVQEWVNFPEYFPRLKALAFFGGIGTIWHCVNHHVPMVAVPGFIGDQFLNALHVQRIGLGISVLPYAMMTAENLGYLLEQQLDPLSCRDRIARFRSEDNYTDTIETVCTRMEALV